MKLQLNSIFQLGKWKHACEIENSEDILADPSRIPYTLEIDTILSPFKDILTKLTMFELDSLADKIIPAKTWLENTKKPLRTTLIPHVGSLSILERARIANWFDTHITLKDKELRLSWLGFLPHAHAHTLYIAHSLASEPKMKNLGPSELLKHAWEVQFTAQPARLVDVDVEKECLSRLEEEMFEVSARADIAGYHQWGLDAGHHQDNWEPYSSLQWLWNKEDHSFGDDDDSYIQVRNLMSTFCCDVSSLH